MAVVDSIEKAERRPRDRKLTKVWIVSQHRADERIFGNQGLRLQQAGTSMPAPLRENLSVVAPNPWHVLQGRCEVHDLDELSALQVNIGCGRGGFMLCIPGPHPGVYGPLRHERALVCAGNRLADHQAFRLCAPLQALDRLFGQPGSRTVLPTSLFLKPALEFRVKTHGEPAAAAHEDHLFPRNDTACQCRTWYDMAALGTIKAHPDSHHDRVPFRFC